MAAKLEKTKKPGVFRQHKGKCPRGERCDCPYVVIWRDRAKKQHKRTFHTYALAVEAKGRRDGGDRRAASRADFEDYARDWLTSYRGRTKRGRISDRTRKLYRRDVERWAIPFFAGSKLAEIEPPEVRAFVTHLEAAGLRASTVRSVLAPVRAMLATAVEDGSLASNPAREIRIGGDSDEQAEDAAEIRALTKAELRELFAEIPDEWRPFFELLTQTGLRISEAIGLQWRDVELGESPELHVRRQDCRGEVGPLKTKNSRRDLPLSPSLARWLWRESRGKRDTAPIFTTKAGTPLSDRNVDRRVLGPAKLAAGVPWVTFHTFRHTCASLLFEDGRRDVKQVSKWLGHANASFTLDVYVHLMDDGKGDAVFFDDVLGPSQGNTRATGDPQTAANGDTENVRKLAS
jgi:integrase